MSKIIENIKEFMKNELDIDTKGIESETLLFSTGIIDSFSLVTLLSFIESTFSIRIGPTDVNLANFDSLARMAAYIKARCDT
ncbi:MAG TPA: phosphopantetheine-containing protein [Nitrosomonas nitrosa]|nr:phosphopantetheine-containing protein [Nitrosomonas nitrosa]HNP52185.1 acyl carrier protein [Nitrosomonas nitrosa]